MSGSVRQQLAEALPDPDKLELLARWLDLDDVVLRRTVSAEPKVQDDLRQWAEAARAALDRHRAEPECGPGCGCGTDCPCYQDGANEGHSMGCNDDSCACYEAGHQAGLEAQRERVGGGTV